MTEKLFTGTLNHNKNKKQKHVFKTYGWLFESRDDPLIHPHMVLEPVRTVFAEGTQRVRREYITR